MAKLKITLGVSYRDTITGFQGVATALNRALGSEQLKLEKANAEGKVPDAEWFETKRLELVAPSAPAAAAPITVSSAPPDVAASAGGSAPAAGEVKEFQRVPIDESPSESGDAASGD